MRFTFLQIPVRIDLSFWVFVALFTRLYQDPSLEKVMLGVVILLSLLVHEYGHALTAFYFGARPSITLEAFGGRASYDPRGISLKQQFLIVLNGPLLESLLIALSYFCLKSGIVTNSPSLQYLCLATFQINLIWCLLNLIPVTPLDGGYLLRTVLVARFGERGYLASLYSGVIFAALIAPVLYFLGFFFFGTLLLFCGWQEFQLLKAFKRAERGLSPQESYHRALDALKRQEAKRGVSMLEKLLISQDPKVQALASESLAKLASEQGDRDRAYQLLLAADPTYLREGKCLLCRLAFSKKNFSLIADLAYDIYEIEPSYEIALLNAKAFESLKQPELATGWQETASQFDRASQQSSLFQSEDSSLKHKK